MFLQFVQQPTPRLELERLRQQAERHFAARLSTPHHGGAPEQATMTLHHPAFGTRTFSLRARPTVVDDKARLGPAEHRNQSHGMAALGERCPCVWEIVPDDDVPLAARFYFGALLASVALGPLLPDDDSGLFGVRSARLRAEALLGSDPTSG